MSRRFVKRTQQRRPSVMLMPNGDEVTIVERKTPEFSAFEPFADDFTPDEIEKIHTLDASGFLDECVEIYLDSHCPRPHVYVFNFDVRRLRYYDIIKKAIKRKLLVVTNPFAYVNLSDYWIVVLIRSIPGTDDFIRNYVTKFNFSITYIKDSVRELFSTFSSKESI